MSSSASSLAQTFHSIDFVAHMEEFRSDLQPRGRASWAQPRPGRSASRLTSRTEAHPPPPVRRHLRKKSVMSSTLKRAIIPLARDAEVAPDVQQAFYFLATCYEDNLRFLLCDILTFFDASTHTFRVYSSSYILTFYKRYVLQVFGIDLFRHSA